MFVAHAAEAAGGAGVGPQAAVPVDAHLPGADAARRVADEPAVVIGRRFGADGLFELDGDGEGRERAAARGGRADDAGRGDLVD